VVHGEGYDKVAQEYFSEGGFMAKAKTKKPVPYRVKMTKAKVVRLVIFAVVTAAGFTLNAYVPAVQHFGWGYAFGMAGMAALTG